MKVKLMGARGLLAKLFSPVADPLRREFWFITGNYRILLISWVIMDLAMEMPHPYYQPYVQEVLGGKDFPMAL
jgi:hypothetical protein